MMTPEEKRHDMLHSPVELLVCKMAVPTIITMLITALYNMADTYFVGRLDTVSTAAVGLALPLMNVIQAIGFFFGHGSGNYKIEPENGLVPVCPNCHAMLHKGKLSIEELRKILSNLLV